MTFQEFRSKRSIIAVAVVAGLSLAGTAGAAIVGFGGSSETGWTANADTASSTAGVPSVTGTGTSADVLALTTAANSEASSYWYNVPQSITNFTESFTYIDVSHNGADGIGVVWQNNTSASSGLSTNALGGAGGNLGFSNLNATAGLALNLYSGNTTSSSGYSANIPGGNNPLVVPMPGGVNVDSGDPINISLSYVDADGALSEKMTDTVTSQTFTRVWRGISISGAVGASTATIGLTGATGGVNAAQNITNFQFTSGAAVSSPAAITPIAATGYSQNMIISSTTGTANMTATMDQGSANFSNCFFEVGTDPTAPVLGVPKGGVVFGSETDPNHSFMLQPTSQNDAILLDPTHGSGALTLTAPSAFSVISFLVSGANGGGAISILINYANGGTQTATINAPDWFGTSPVAWYANGRASVNSPNGTWSYNDINNAPNQQPVLYEEDLTLTDTTDAVTSINFTYGGSNREVVYGISGAAPVPEPATLGVAAIGALGLLARRRRSVR